MADYNDVFITAIEEEQQKSMDKISEGSVHTRVRGGDPTTMFPNKSEVC